MHKSCKILSCLYNYFIASKGYKIIQYKYEGDHPRLSGIVIDRKYYWYAKSSISRRLLRAEVTNYYHFLDDCDLVIAKHGIFKKIGDNFVKCLHIPRGSKPLNLCILPNGHMFFGEYFQNIGKDAVHIYGSFDYGETWCIVFTFKPGNINHIHGLFYDKFTGRIWVLTGDREKECIIGYTEDEFKSFHEVFRGGQEYRSCQLFFYTDFIVFATDSQYIQNEIKCFDRETLEIKILARIQGSAIKGGQSGNISFLSTTVEPSKVNTEKNAHIWLTKDGLHWEDVYSAPKDWWPSIFQFGTFEFPQYATPIKDRLYFSGRALKGLDGKTTFIEI